MNTDGNDIMFAFNTYEKFRKERLQVNYENTLKLWDSLPSGLPNIDNRRVKGYTSRQQRMHMGKVSLYGVYCALFKRTFLKNKICSQGRKMSMVSDMIQFLTTSFQALVSGTNH
jgi:hypothetical protein